MNILFIKYKQHSILADSQSINYFELLKIDYKDEDNGEFQLIPG